MRVSHDVSNETDNEDPRSGYQLVDGWPNYPSEMRFEMGSGIAVDDEGTIYLFTRDIEHSMLAITSLSRRGRSAP